MEYFPIFFSATNNNEWETTESPPPRDIEESWIGVPPSSTSDSETNLKITEGIENNTNAGLLKVLRTNTWGSLTNRVGSLLKSKDNTINDADTNNELNQDEKSKTTDEVESETESDSSHSAEKEEKPTEENERRRGEDTGRGRSSSRRRRSRRSQSRSQRSPSVPTSAIQIDHIKFLAHGSIWTCLGIFFSWTGFVLAYLARSSTEFVVVDPPIYFDPNFETVSAVGMINLRLCFNESYIGRSGCTTHELSSEDVDDLMFQLSRSVAFLAVLFGGIMSAFLTTTIFWQSINLRPIGGGFMIAYLFQSFAFLFFDANLCDEHKCRVGSGAFCGILATIMWVFACVATSRMDSFKYRQIRRLRRKRARALRRAHNSSRSPSPYKRPKESKSKLNRKVSTATAATTDTAYDRGEDSQHDLDVIRDPRRVRKSFVAIEGIQDIEAAQAWKDRRDESNNRAKRHEMKGFPGVKSMESRGRAIATGRSAATHNADDLNLVLSDEAVKLPSSNSRRGRSRSASRRGDSSSSLTRRSSRLDDNLHDSSRTQRTKSKTRERSAYMATEPSHIMRRGNGSDPSVRRARSSSRHTQQRARSSSRQRRASSSKHWQHHEGRAESSRSRPNQDTQRSVRSTHRVESARPQRQEPSRDATPRRDSARSTSRRHPPQRSFSGQATFPHTERMRSPTPRRSPPNRGASMNSKIERSNTDRYSPKEQSKLMLQQRGGEPTRYTPATVLSDDEATSHSNFFTTLGR